MPVALAAAAFLAGAMISLATSWLLVFRLERVGERLGLSEALLGLVAALAADAPEVTAAITAMAGRQPRLGAGVVIGSNVFNLAALLGLSAVVAGRIGLHRRVVVPQSTPGNRRPPRPGGRRWARSPRIESRSTASLSPASAASASYRARLNRRSTSPTQNWPICAPPAMPPPHSPLVQTRQKLFETNNNAPFVALRNCEERCRLRTSGRKGQRIRVPGRTTVG